MEKTEKKEKKKNKDSILSSGENITVLAVPHAENKAWPAKYSSLGAAARLG